MYTFYIYVIQQLYSMFTGILSAYTIYKRGITYIIFRILRIKLKNIKESPKKRTNVKF